MKMPGMAAAHGLEPHMLNLLPVWMEAGWTAVFLLVAASHLRHMAHTTGQQRSWHACHVLIAVGMAFMYAPAEIDPLAVPSSFWKLVFACAGVIAAAWAIGGVGRVSTLVWLLTSIDLCAMLYMWSARGGAQRAPLTWLLAVYLVSEAVMWVLDLHRRVDGTTPIVSWRTLANESGVTLSAACAQAGSGSLLGELDISASMIAMALGMAYMLVAMQLM